MLKKLLKKIRGSTLWGLFLSAIIAVSVLLAALGISWIGTCGIIKLITLCFGWKFDWLIASGVWLVMMLLSSVFKSNTTVNK